MENINKDLIELRKEIVLLKRLVGILMSEGELSDYAKAELEKARKDDENNFVSLSEL